MNTIKKILVTSIMVCTALFLCGIGQAKAQVAAAPGLSYSFMAFDAATNGPIVPTTKTIRYVIKIVNHTNNIYGNVTITPTGFCLKSLVHDYGCVLVGKPISETAIYIGSYSTVVVPLQTVFKFSDLIVKKNGLPLVPQPNPVPSLFPGTMISCVNLQVLLSTDQVTPFNINMCDVVMQLAAPAGSISGK